MPLSKQDNDYHLPTITQINPKLVDIDRVFTNVLPLLKYQGAAITRGRSKFVTIADLVQSVCRDDTLHFQGFTEQEDIVHGWLESDFLSLVHRGDADKQQVAAPLPMHLNTYKLRNAELCRDYGVADQIFSLLYHAAPGVLRELRDFLFRGADVYTDRYDGQAELDIETLLMMRILDQKEQDYPDPRKPVDIPRPLCMAQGRILGDDIARLLAYQNDVPRLVLIGYIKNVMALHVGTYMLRLFQLVPSIVAHGQRDPRGSTCLVDTQQGALLDACVYPVHIITDMGEDYRSHMAALARRQFSEHVEQLNRYVRAHILLKKLREFADDLAYRGRPVAAGSIEEILALRNYDDAMEFKTYFEIRIRNLMAADTDEVDERLVMIRRLGLTELDTYVEMIYLLRQNFHQKYYLQLLDSLFQKNRENGLLVQGYGRINRRRYALGSGLLETLVQIAVLEPAGRDGFRTRSIRVDAFMEWLRMRYGIYIGRLPTGREPTVADLEALRLNVRNFRGRLREIGFYTDLSDAYIAQVIRPRYPIE